MNGVASSADAIAGANAGADSSPGSAATGSSQAGCTVPAGIMIRGRPEFEQQTLGALAELAATPTGSALLQRIAANGKTCVITESLAGNSCAYKSSADRLLRPDGTPGPGTIPNVRFNPMAMQTGGAEAWDIRPPAIGLGHELIHAIHAMEGTIDPTILPNPGIDPLNPTHATSTKAEELRTVGLPPFEDEALTENALRREWSTPQPHRKFY